MAKKKAAPPSKRRRITFSLYFPGAGQVSLVGDFNLWNEKVHPMKANAEGLWSKILMLSPGRYEYKFLVDGQWYRDPNNTVVCENCYGTHNNVLTVA